MAETKRKIIHFKDDKDNESEEEKKRERKKLVEQGKRITIEKMENFNGIPGAITFVAVWFTILSMILFKSLIKIMVPIGLLSGLLWMYGSLQAAWARNDWGNIITMGAGLLVMMILCAYLMSGMITP